MKSIHNFAPLGLAKANVRDRWRLGKGDGFKCRVSAHRAHSPIAMLDDIAVIILLFNDFSGTTIRDSVFFDRRVLPFVLSHFNESRLLHPSRYHE